jgi:hypothetical protein
MGGLGPQKNSFFKARKKRDFEKVIKPLSTLTESGIGGRFFVKNKNVVKRTMRYHFEGVNLAKWEDEK